jgi:transposase-like protein
MTSVDRKCPIEGRLTRRQQAGIAALLACPTLEAAARSIGVSARTLRRWLREPDFKAAYEHAQREAFTLAIGRLQSIATAAVDALDGLIRDGETPAAVRASAARGILELVMKAVELAELRQRLDELEAIVAKSGEYSCGRCGRD